MGEISIDPKFNIHTTYKKVRILNPYRNSGAPAQGSYILDTYPAAVAYSIARRLSSSYTGSLIRVRRISDSVEKDIGYDSNGDLDMDAYNSFATSEVCIIIWYDQSGNGNDALQANTGYAPRIETNSLYSKPSVRADGNLTAPDSPSLRITGDMTVIGTFFRALPTIGNPECLFVKRTSDNLREFEFRNEPSGLRYLDSANSIIPVADLEDTVEHIFSIFRTADRIKGYDNNVAEGNIAKSNPTITTTSGLSLFSRDDLSQFKSKGVQTNELIFFASDLESSRADLESHLNTYYI